jgi:hypothetical protein
MPKKITMHVGKLPDHALGITLSFSDHVSRRYIAAGSALNRALLLL